MYVAAWLVHFSLPLLPRYAVGTRSVTETCVRSILCSLDTTTAQTRSCATAQLLAQLVQQMTLARLSVGSALLDPSAGHTGPDTDVLW